MPPYRIEWLDEARADIRTLDRPTAMRVFEGVLRFARTGAGDVKALQGDMTGALRLRLGDYRVLFTIEGNAMRMFGVRHRSEAYR
jgi:mRNA interferase RelE/StbE